MLKKLLLASAVLAICAGVNAANAAEFTLSSAFGTGNFGTIFTQDLGAGTVQVQIDMSPNFIIDTGEGHLALTLSLLGTGRIDATTIDALNPLQPAGSFTPLPHLAVANYQNSPFGLFTDAIEGDCGNGASSGGCGSTLVFNILNFQGFGPATNLFDPPPPGGPTFPVFAAMDIFLAPEGPTGAVGVTVAPGPRSVTPVPGPIVGAGIPGIIAACVGLMGLARRRRKMQVA
jgi:hypothetical protein